MKFLPLKKAILIQAAACICLYSCNNRVTYSRDGSTMYCVYHGRTQKTGPDRVVFISPMEIKDGLLRIDGEK